VAGIPIFRIATVQGFSEYPCTCRLPSST
jgi:hypothetical protein